MPKPTEGQPAPPFTLPASTGGTISLSDFQGKSHVVLYFYPKDLTSGCTKVKVEQHADEVLAFVKSLG